MDYTYIYVERERERERERDRHSFKREQLGRISTLPPDMKNPVPLGHAAIA